VNDDRSGVVARLLALDSGPITPLVKEGERWSSVQVLRVLRRDTPATRLRVASLYPMTRNKP
jgi:hypothetical protein